MNTKDKTYLQQLINQKQWLDAAELLVKESDKGGLSKISHPAECVPHLRKYALSRQEHFCVATLDGAHHIVQIHCISKGIANRALVHPREVFRPALIDSACAVILFHNHPSGESSPSIEDTEITKNLCKAAEVVGIPILDHIIVVRHGYYSFVENGFDFCSGKK